MIGAKRAISHVEFWPLSRLLTVTGISKSEIYRQMRLGLFPKSHSYRDTSTRKFWLSSDVKQWQLDQLSGVSRSWEQEEVSDFDALLK